MLTAVLLPWLPALFSLTLFLSAGLLFIVELMIAKMILPLLGGTPAVWNTSMMFFQALLLAGYASAHMVSRKTGVAKQIILHLVVFLAACIVLPIALPTGWLPPTEGSPIGYILLLLLVSMGLPFFVLSVNTVLLQRWFADTGHPSAKDPYFLYSASNLGSMLGLIGYPILIEPYFRLAQQSRIWTLGYVILLALVVFCAWLTRQYLSSRLPEGMEKDETFASDDPRVTFGRRVHWVMLAFVPSSLMLGVTTFLSTDVAAIPLFWVIPLSLYLLSFIIVFARVPALIHRVMVILFPISIIALIFLTFYDTDTPKWVVFLCHLLNLFIYSMVCHGEIAGSRPDAGHLTEFYIWISVGGVLGGIFNSLIAPLAFDTILEYPLILMLGALLLPVGNGGWRFDWKDWRSILLYLAVPIVLVFLTYWPLTKLPLYAKFTWLADLLHVELKSFYQILSYGCLGLICYGLLFLKRPFIFGIGITALMMTLVVSKDASLNIVHRERSFFGVLAVVSVSNGQFMNLYHGTTIHGRQALVSDKRFEPLAYYHRQGPVGQVLSEFEGEKKSARIAVAGLGAGAIAAYAGPGQEIHFYEIDPAVKMIAINPGYFTYLDDCRGDWKIILGDARLTLEKAPPNYYGIIILDAFSSDAIPVHLLTKEAVNLYLSKLAIDGVLLFHISNKYVNLAPVLASLADENGLASRICEDDEDAEIDKYGTTYVMLARKEEDFGSLAESDAWKSIERRQDVKAWTDDFSNLLVVFKW